MLNDTTYKLYFIAATEMRDFHSRPDRLRMTSFYRRFKSKKQGKIVTFIFHRAGKALVSTGNRLLEIA